MEYSDKERKALKEFRERFHDLNLTNEQSEDSYLIRWLRARDLNLSKAEEMLRKTHLGIKGLVRDAKTGQGIPNALIHVQNITRINRTHSMSNHINHDVTSVYAGDYYRLLTPGTYLVSASFPGYKPQMRRVKVTNQPHHEATRLDFWLEENPRGVSLQWRAEHKIDSILDWTPPEIYYKMYPMEICGYDKDGYPIAVFPSKFFDTDLFWELDRAEYIRYTVWTMEKLVKAMEKFSTPENPITAFVGIYDLQGFNVRAVMSRQWLQVIQEGTKILDDNYPEMLHKGYAVYAPRIFTILYSMMKHFVPKRTIEKFNVLGGNPEKWSHILLKHIEENRLPPMYGGTNVKFQETAFKNCGTKSISRRVSLAGEVEVDGFLEIYVEAGKTMEFNYEISKPNSILRWCFKTEGYDIGFSVTFEDSSVLVPYERLETQDSKKSGHLICKDKGTYTLIFDNSYSRFRGKSLHLKVEVEEDGFIIVNNTPAL